MTILKDSTDDLPSLRKRLGVPDCSCWCTGCVFLLVVSFVVNVSMIFFAPWTLTIFCWLATILCIMCYLYGFTMSWGKNNETLPLVSPKGKKHESKNRLEKILIAECSNLDSVKSEKCRNSKSVCTSPQTDEVRGNGYPDTYKASVGENNVDVNKEEITCVEFNSNRIKVCHEQYVTGGGRKKRKEKNRKCREPQGGGGGGKKGGGEKGEKGEKGEGGEKGGEKGEGGERGGEKGEGKKGGEGGKKGGGGRRGGGGRKGGGNFLKNVFRRLSISEAQDESQPQKAEIPASEVARQGTSKEGTFRAEEQPVSQGSAAAAGPLSRQNIRTNIPDSDGTQTKQSLVVKFPRRIYENIRPPQVQTYQNIRPPQVQTYQNIRPPQVQTYQNIRPSQTYENIRPSQVQKPNSAKTGDPNSGTQLANPSNIGRPLDTKGPYQNLPLRNQEVMGSASATGVRSTPKAANSPGGGASFSSAMFPGNVTQGHPRPYSCYENLNLLRSGYFAPPRPQGVHFNVPATSQHKSPSKQAAGTSAFENHSLSKKGDKNSTAADKKSAIAPTQQPVTSMRSAGQLERHNEEWETSLQLKNKFSPLDVSDDYMDMAVPWSQQKQYQLFPDSAEGFDSGGSSKAETGRISPEKHTKKTEAGRTVKDKTSNIQSSGAVLATKDSHRIYGNVLGSSAPATSTTDRDVSTDERKKHGGKLSSVKSHDASNIRPVQGLPQTDHDKVKASLSGRRESTPLVHGKMYVSVRPIPEKRKQHGQSHETEPELKHKSKPETCDSKVSHEIPNWREGLPPGPASNLTARDESRSHSRQSNPLYCERRLYVPSLHNTGRMAPNIHDPSRFVEGRNSSKLAKYSLPARPVSDSKNSADGATTSARRSLALSEDDSKHGWTLVPERHRKVSHDSPEHRGRLPRGQLQSSAARFSNETYLCVSELDRKRSEAARCQAVEDTAGKSESEWSADTETDDYPVFEEPNMKGREFETQGRGASASRGPGCRRPPRRTYKKQSTYINPDLDVLTNRSVVYKCLEGGSFEIVQSRTKSKTNGTSVSKANLNEREANVSASEEHSAGKRSPKKFATLSEVQSEETVIRAEDLPERIPPEPRVLVVPSKRPEIRHASPVRLPEPNPSTSEETDDTETDSTMPDRCHGTKQAEGGKQTRRNRCRTRSEYMDVTEILAKRSYSRSCSSDAQHTNPMQDDSADARRGYSNPEYESVLPSPQKNFLEKGRTSEGSYQTRGKDADLSGSRSSRFCAVGSSKSPSRSQDLQSREHERSSMVHRARSLSTSSLPQFAANTPVIIEGMPESEESRTTSSLQKRTDLLTTSVSQEPCSPEHAGKFNIKESRSTPRASAVTEKPAFLPESGYAKPEDSSRIRSREKLTSYTENNSPRYTHFTPGHGRINTTVPRSIDDKTGPASTVISLSPPAYPPPPPPHPPTYPPPPPPRPPRPSPSKSLSKLSLENTSKTAGSILKQMLSPKKDKSVHFSLPSRIPPMRPMPSDLRAAMKPLQHPESVTKASFQTTHSSPSKMREPTQVQQRSLATDMPSSSGLPPTEPRFAASPETFSLPLIENRSTILNLRLGNPSTANRSVPLQPLGSQSPSRNLPPLSPGPVAEANSSPRSETNLPHPLPSESSIRSPEPVVPLRPSSRNLGSPSQQKSPEAVGGPLQPKLPPKLRKSRSVTLPETPLTMLNAPDQPSERSHSLHELKD